MKKKVASLRWILLAAGIVAVIGLTAMNVYSLYTLHSANIESEKQSRKIQVAEFADRIRSRFFNPFFGIASVEMEHIEQTFNQTGQFPQKAVDILQDASGDSIFTNIYYIPANSEVCRNDSSLLRYNPERKQFRRVTSYPEAVCDGMGIARTRMKALIDDYRYNNKVLFDTHRSMFIALVNQETQTVIGYLAMPINREYMVNEYLQPKMASTFGVEANSNLNVWLRDWTNGEIIAKSNPQADYNYKKVEIIQQFPDFFDDWRLFASVNQASPITASNLWINMILLGAAFIFLIGAMLFMFYSAQKERELAARQSEFLANVTHELKTPISVMQAAGENLADGRVDNQERLKSYGSHIYSEAVRLGKMINQLLDVAKADAGQAFIRRKPIAINQVVKKFLHEHQSYIHDKGFTTDIRIPKLLPNVMADEDSLNTVLSNIINNAIKYSNKDKFLGVYLSHQGKDVILKIEDHGVGMKKETVNHIFEKFYRGEDSLTAETKGYGLGLSIVKNLVDLNGGTVSVNSRKGEGSTFTVTFPALSDKADSAENHSDSATTTQPMVTHTKNTTDYVKQ